MLRKFLRIAVGSVIIALAGIGVGPWLLYGVGLAKIDGRPTHSSQAVVMPNDAEALFRELRITQPMQVDPLSPYFYIGTSLWGKADAFGPSVKIAWQIARSYNVEHLPDHRFWHLSGAALTIWLTRNWTANELVAKAVELEKARDVANGDR